LAIDRNGEAVNLPPKLEEAVKNHTYPLLFATIDGAHLYGLPCAKMHFSIRGVHVLPIEQMIGLDLPEDLVELTERADDADLELSTHDVKKFFQLMLNDNGHVLEQIYSPLVVFTSDEHDELKEIGKSCLTRLHCYHYLGLADAQWQMLGKENCKKVSQLLSVYRIVLTGTHLMNAATIETNLKSLNQTFALSYLDELLERAREDDAALNEIEWNFHKEEYERLREVLEDAADATMLPERSNARGALNDLLKRVRMTQPSN